MVTSLRDSRIILKLPSSLHSDVSNIPLSTFGALQLKEVLDPYRKLHQQDDGTILACAATGTSSQDSLVAWLKLLERERPLLKNIPVIIANVNRDLIQ